MGKRVLVRPSYIVVVCLPPDGELQYPVRPFDEDEGFLSAAVEGGSVDVDELVADFQLLAQGSLSTILDLGTKTHVEIKGKKKKTGRQTEAPSD